MYGAHLTVAARVPVAGRRGETLKGRAENPPGEGRGVPPVEAATRSVAQGPKSARWCPNLTFDQIDSRSRTTFFPRSTVVLSRIIFVDSREINRGCVVFAHARPVIWRRERYRERESTPGGFLVPGRTTNPHCRSGINTWQISIYSAQI